MIYVNKGLELHSFRLCNVQLQNRGIGGPFFEGKDVYFLASRKVYCMLVLLNMPSKMYPERWEFLSQVLGRDLGFLHFLGR